MPFCIGPEWGLSPEVNADIRSRMSDARCNHTLLHHAILWSYRLFCGLSKLMHDLQGDECAEQDALRLKEQLSSSQSAQIEVEGEQVTITPSMVDIKQEHKSGG